MKRFRSSLAPLLLLALCICIPTRAADWPQWRGPLRTGYVPEGQAVPTSLPSTPKILWHFAIADGVSSPIVNGGRVFYLDAANNKETVHAVDAATGAEIWHAELDDLHKDSQSKPGPRCTPLADGDRVYAQSCKGQLRCYAAADGKPIWDTNFVKDFGSIFIGEKGKAEGATRHGYTGSPIIDGDHLIDEVGGKDAGLVCFDKKTGSVIWKSEPDTPAYAAPIIATVAGVRQVICFMADGVICVDPASGKKLWKSPVKTSLARHATTPTVAGDIVMVASHEVGLVGVKLTREGDTLKEEQAWLNKDAKINFSSPVVIGRHLYGLGPNRNLLCIDAQTGQQIWSQENFLGGNASKSEIGMIVAGANLMILTDEGQLVLVSADPAGYKELARTRVCGHNWCNPAFADRKLYLRDDKELMCVELMP
jgi:outer membrane protein assembly factor BamB